MLTCRANDVEPYEYLLHILDQLPQRGEHEDVTDLLPFNYARTPSSGVAIKTAADAWSLTPAP